MAVVQIQVYLSLVCSREMARLVNAQVFHMVGGPQDMFAPGMLLRVLRFWLADQLKQRRGSSGGDGSGSGGDNGSGLAQPGVAAAEVTRV